MIIENDIEKFRSLKPSTFRFLKAINLVRDVGAYGSTPFKIEMMLCRVSGDVTEDLRVRFTGAVDIKINRIESMFGMFLTIEDIRARQLEGLSYHVSEQENDTFSFDCNGFHIELL